MTLIEAIMVIMLLTAAATSSMVYFEGGFVSRGETRMATVQVADSMQLARNTAILKQTNVSVRRNRGSASGQIQITQHAGPQQDERVWLVDLPSGVSVAGSPIEVTFRPTGQADQRLDWAISDGQSKGAVEVLPVAGTIQRSTP